MSPMSPRRLKWLATISIITIVLLGLWLIRSESGEISTPNMPVKPGSRPKVTLRQGTFYGIEFKGSLPQHIEEFLGIPYGLSTGGEARFKPPVRIENSTREFDAGNYGNRCPAGSGSTYSEDCLMANIFRPKTRDQGKKLPVVVYVHGGAFNSGFGNVREMDSFIGWSAEPIIGVSFNYRTGAFGFLPSKLAAKAGLLNAGLRDQALLFAWVQENIAAFGGDPDNVTLMGNSAGAHSIGHHLFQQNEEAPLFHRVIIESGASTARACYPYDNTLHEKQFQDFLQYLGMTTTPEDQIISTLRTFSTDAIKAASDFIFNKYNPSVRWPFQPVIDGQGGIISRPPIDTWRAGKWHKIPIMTGFNTNEGAMFVPTQLSSSKQFTDFFHTLLPGLSEQDLKKLDTLYPDPLIDSNSKYEETRAGLGPQFKRTEQAYGHFAYIAPVRATANFASSSSNAPVYLYRFAASSSVKGGADHGTHSPFVTYSEQIRHVSSKVNEISGSMHAYWTSFIATGDPNLVKGKYSNRPEWPMYVDRKGEGELVIFGEGNDEVAGGDGKGVVVQVRDDDWPVEESEFWWERTLHFES